MDMKPEPHTPDYTYTSRMTRRDSLKWLSILSASALVPSLSACEAKDQATSTAELTTGHWPDLKLKTIQANGYGKDPEMVSPNRAAWPKTLTPTQLTLVAILSDLIVPKDGHLPSASEVGVPDVIDEWVSAPYDRQQRERLDILSTLAWIDTESEIRFTQKFAQTPQANQFKTLDDIAYRKDGLASEFSKIADAFSVFRRLVLAAFYCSPEGSADLGYMGNTPVEGDYPGPTDEAMAHLKTMLSTLNLTL